MHLSLVLLLFVHLAACEEDESTTPPAWSGHAEVYSNVKQGSARQFLGSSFVRDDIGLQKQQQQLRSGGARKQNQKQQQQQQQQQQQHEQQHQQHLDYIDEDLLVNPSDYPPLEHPDEFDYSDHDHDVAHGAHEIFTTEPLQPDKQNRAGGSTSHGNIGRPRFRDISGSRTDLYEVRESGDRSMGATRGREKYMQVWHNKEKVFIPPKIALVNEDAHPLNPNDGTIHECPNECNPFQWQCVTSCVCIDHMGRCDKEAQCEDGSDELDCDILGDMMSKRRKECEQTGTHVMCPKTYRCIHQEWLCDGDDDCGDYSDETHCGAHFNCTDDQFECQNGFCIQKKWVCDGENDCKDFSDEANCSKITCSPDHFTCRSGYCVALAFHCDGDSDCPDDDDELECQRVTNSCPEGEFKCRGGLGGAGGPSGHCVLNRFRCDGDNDCGDWSDEENCSKKPIKCSSSEFQCADGECIPKRWKCDKEQDCDGGEDEKVCGNMNQSQPSTCGSDEFTCLNGRCILRTWLCDGYPDCSSAEDEVDCHLQCDPGQFLCPAKKNITNLKICVHQKHVCDGQYDCPLGEDEINCPHARECENNTKCEQLCITSARGSPECACRLGYLMHENRQNCTDIDECQYLTNPVCSQKCTNTAGSFTCSCEMGYILRPDLRTCKALGGAMQLLVANRWDIRRVFLSNNRYNAIVKGLHNAIALDFHYRKGLLFWSDVATDVIKVAHVNGTRVRDIIKWGLESPAGLAVDWVHDLLFWTDSGTRRVEVSTFEGNLRAVIAANDLDKPRAIVAHPGEASVFWSDWGPNPKIERAYMDGSQRQMIIGKGVTWPNGLAIDYPSNKLYWADAKQHAIECSNFDGSSRVKILSTHLPHPFALTIFEDTMYWTDWNTKTVSAANKITGKGFRSVHENFHFPMDVHAYHPARQPEYTDRCQKDRRGLRGGCSHMCLPNKSSRRCSCPVGLTLKDDGKTCNNVPDNLVLVARHKDIRLLQLNGRSSSATNDIDMIIPLDNLKHAVALDWCSETDFIYWSDVERSSINKAHLNGSYQQKLIHTNLVSPAGLALDWVTDKVYWTDWGTNRIEVATTDGKMRSTLLWEKLEKPRDIVVNPIDGIMFWSNWGDEAMIERAGMDGKSRMIVTAKNLKWPNGLAIDYDQQKLYFVDGGFKTLENINFDGSSRKLIINSGLGHPFGLDISNNRVYWTDWLTNSAHSANKLNGKDIITLIDNTSNLMDIRVFHRSRRRSHNSCGTLNGGCSHLCLLNQGGYSCACPIGVQLKDDQHNCSDGPSHYILFAHRFDIRQISLDFDHLIDVVLPLPPITNAVTLDVDQQTGIIYWADTTENVIMSSTHDGLHVNQVIGENLEHTEGLVVDSVGRNIYWTDAGRHTIEVAHLDGKDRHVIAWKDLDSPRGLALDYEVGYMFWTDWGFNRKIDRADMDGENREHIITSNLGWPNGLTLDLKAKRIYWIDAQLKTIDSCDYTGNKRQMIMSALHHPYALALTDDFIYWTDWKSKALHRAERRNISAKIDVIQNIEGLMDIKVITTNATLPENVCGTNNGGCSHLCLRNPTGFSCKCPIGVKLKDGSTTECQILPDDYLLIALRSGIGMISLNTVDFMDVVLPISGVHGAVVLDFHYRKNLLFYADVNLDIIRRVNLLNCSETKTIVSTDLLTPNGICVDWLADNIFWSDTERKVIEVARLDGSSRKKLIEDDLVDPRSMIIYPKKGYLFWADWGVPRIERSLLDGSNRTHVVTEKLGYPTGLTIDFDKRRLLWTDALDDCINQVDFNGNRRANIIMYAPHPFGLTMFERTYYWTDWFNKTVYQAYPTNRGLTQAPVRRSLIGALDIRAVSQQRQPQEWNQCVQDNGGCTHLCLYRGFDYVCACPDLPDGRECKLSPKSLVPRRSDDMTVEYGDDTASNNNDDKNENDLDDDNDYDAASNAASREAFVIIASGVVTVMLILIIIAILLLMFNSKRNKTKRGSHSRGSSRSVLTFSNPNYNVGDTPMEPKTNIWKRFKYDRTQERVYEERSLTTETASSSLFVPTPSPMASPSTKNNAMSTLATIA